MNEHNNIPRYDVIIVGGLGHIGLPLGIAFAQQGLQVALHDINEAYAAEVRAGRLPFIEYGAEEVLREVLQADRLHIRMDAASVAEARQVVVCLGTPVDEYLNPKTGQFLDIMGRLVPYLRPEQTIIIRSSVFPHTIEQLLRRLGPGNWKVAYCPERIVQGYAMQELYKLPQIVAGISPEAEEEAARLFGHLAPEIVRTTLQEAELVKLFANAWRYIKFAVANQFYMICEQNGVDYTRVRQAMRQGYERAQDIPGAGFAAGPCLLKDTMQLANFTGNNFLLGHSAMMVNEGLPNFLVNQLQQEVGSLAGKRIALLGMAFKADIDDARDSLSFKLAKLLRFAGAELRCTDEYFQRDGFLPLEEALAGAEIVIVGVPHSRYRGLAMPATVYYTVDLWNCVQAPVLPAPDADSVRG
jgi:UDP-N-acetyl-D-mannosaminuronic acid dehydrogenase